MKLKEICDKLNLKVISGSGKLDNEISGVYICDLLSWVMSHAKKGDIWITVMTHSNIVAVASLLELGCIIVPENIEIDKDTIDRADTEEIPILSSPLNSYELAVSLYDLNFKKKCE